MLGLKRVTMKRASKLSVAEVGASGLIRSVQEKPVLTPSMDGNGTVLAGAPVLALAPKFFEYLVDYAKTSVRPTTHEFYLDEIINHVIAAGERCYGVQAEHWIHLTDPHDLYTANLSALYTFSSPKYTNDFGAGFSKDTKPVPRNGVFEPGMLGGDRVVAVKGFNPSIPSVTITPPVYVHPSVTVQVTGRNSHDRMHFGPSAIICEGARVEPGSSIETSVALPSARVSGTVKHALVHGNDALVFH